MWRVQSWVVVVFVTVVYNIWRWRHFCCRCHCSKTVIFALIRKPPLLRKPIVSGSLKSSGESPKGRKAPTQVNQVVVLKMDGGIPNSTEATNSRVHTGVSKPFPIQIFLITDYFPCCGQIKTISMQIHLIWIERLPDG